MQEASEFAAVWFWVGSEPQDGPRRLVKRAMPKSPVQLESSCRPKSLARKLVFFSENTLCLSMCVFNSIF